VALRRHPHPGRDPTVGGRRGEPANRSLHTVDLPDAVINLRPAVCALCGQMVNVSDGTGPEYGQDPVRHLGACPADRFNRAGAPTWAADKPENGVSYPGQIRRAAWPSATPGTPPADAVPGGRTYVDDAGTEMTSGIVVVVADWRVRAATTREAAHALMREENRTPRVQAMLAADDQLKQFVQRIRTSVAAAQALLARGYRPADIRNLAQFCLRDAEDVADLDAELLRKWYAGTNVFVDVTPAEARQLLAAGINATWAKQLQEVGYLMAGQVLTAAPPEIRPDATRIVLRTTEYNGRSRVTTDPAAARAFVAADSQRWRPDRLRVESGPRPIQAYNNWSVWDDGRLVLDAIWLAGSAGERPDTLHRAACVGIDLCVNASNRSSDLDPRTWRTLVDAVDESRQAHEHHRASGFDEMYSGAWSAHLRLMEHTFTRGDGGQIRLFAVTESSSYSAPDAAGTGSRYALFDTEPAARADFAARARRLEDT
jgi:hypothetical protein